MSIKQSKDFLFTKLAFQQAEVNLGSTSTNPSVGCIIVKKDSVVSSGRTSVKGRPHAEANALKRKLNFKDSILYSTLEPCSHFGKTGPCTEKIIRNKIKKVIFSTTDWDLRSANKALSILKKKKIQGKKNVLNIYGKNFYKSCYNSKNTLPLLEGKIAISKDFFSINKKKKYISNNQSRKLGNFLRSRYDCLLTTSETVNEDNPLLNCRIEALTHKSPSIAIIDRNFKLKKNLKIFNNKPKRIFLIVNIDNKKKEIFFKNKGVMVIKNKKKNNDLKNVLMILKRLNFNRIFVESGLTFLNSLINRQFLKKLYIFQSSQYLKKSGTNNNSSLNIKKLIKKNKKIKINLKDDTLYLTKI